MPDRTADLPRRSCLSVPGSNPRMMAKAPSLAADMVFLDLEDAVAPSQKDAARLWVIDAIRTHDWGDKVLGVRVNGWAGSWTYLDLIEVVGRAGDRLDVIVLPKVERAADVIAVELLVAQIERSSGRAGSPIGIEAQIETAKGLLAINEICASSNRLETVILGPVDLSASLGMTVAGGLLVDSYPGDYFHHVYMTLLIAARANGLQVIDGPYVQVRDQVGLAEYSRRAQVLGFDGKWVLHPDQIPVVNELFSPTQAQYDRACELLDAYDLATVDQGRGAVMFGEEMIDEASAKSAAKIVSIGRRAGLVLSH